MPRLTSMPGRLGAMKPRIAPAPKVVDPFYLSKAWRDLRAAKKAQGPAFCCVCGKGGKLILDHRTERKDGGADLPPLDETDWYCVGHHNGKTAAARAQRVWRR